MTDFVTRLETELRDAAVRRERAGRLRGVALPKLRVAIRDLPATAVTTVLLGITVVGAAIILSASPERAAEPGVPGALRGDWRAGATELRLYPAGADRCAKLGLESSEPCYTIANARTHVVGEWGDVSVTRDQLTLRAAQGGAPGLYRWVVEGGTLRLTQVRDSMTDRAQALTSEPLNQVRRRRAQPRLPIGWTAHTFTSERYGYSIRYPAGWSARAAPADGQADRLSRDPGSSALPDVSIAAEELPATTTPADWTVIVNSRSEAAGCAPYHTHSLTAGGETIRITSFRNCDGVSRQWASFVHDGSGYSVLWRGRPGLAQVEADTPRFDALLRTIVLSP
jgi:hypothetical protein